MFEKKSLLITGGTGSFGNAVVKRLINSGLREIRICSRDEKKQDEMRRKYNNPKLKFFLCDVRDPTSVLNAVRGADFIFHAAALKQVPSCEFHPMEAVKTNVLGTENVLEAAMTTSVEKVVCLSTDKAVYPINSMGISKAMMEKVAIAKARTSEKTKICITRYGNVMASRGSVIPLFTSQVMAGKNITITDPNMTRFMMTLDNAIDLVLYAFENGRSGDTFVLKSPAVTIKDLAQSMIEILDAPTHPITCIGTRHGEKLFEVLLSREEMAAAEDLGAYYRIAPDTRDMNYERFVEEGEQKISTAVEYTSHNTEMLNVKQMKRILKSLEFIRSASNNSSSTRTYRDEID